MSHYSIPRANKARGARASDAKALGCACDDAKKVPKAGAPEYISGLGNYVRVGDTQSVIEKADAVIHSGAGRSVASAAMLYHGYKRNHSVAWALAWAALGYVAPVMTPVVAAAQGFGKGK